jgi:murein DD-endopeptidase MepM/ murein hydrolase activator NlpD
LVLQIEDNETGLQNISVRIIHNLQTYLIAEHSFPSHGVLSPDGGKQHSFELDMVPYADPALSRKLGEAKLIVTARDYSWRNLFEGNGERISQSFTPKFTPPRLELLSPPRSITQGGAGFVRYRVSHGTSQHGIQIDTAFFPGFPKPNEDGMFALIAFPYNAKPDTPIQLVAHDGFGNTAMLDLDYKVKPKRWRTRQIRITDRFINKVVGPIIAQSADIQEQKDHLSNFLEVNTTLRKINNDKIAELATNSRPEFLWKGAFRQPPGSQVEAAFADHRKYVYKGQIVDTQDHLGFDLAVTKHYPVQAGNNGIVVLAEYLGIYGNTIIIDHGYGLQSLYAHLSSFGVKKGETVKIGQVIARSGTTGLAGGDHLHFSLILQGQQINPTEWWDPYWVKTRINDRLGLAWPSDSSQQEGSPTSNPFGPTLAPPQPKTSSTPEQDPSQSPPQSNIFDNP